MGIGNLEHVLSDYDGGRPVPYAQLYFDSAPDHHAGAFNLLAGFGDQSSLYYWRVLGAVADHEAVPQRPRSLARLAALQTARDSTAAVLHPPDRTPVVRRPGRDSPRRTRAGRSCRSRSNAAKLALAYSPSMGSGARRVGAPQGALPRPAPGGARSARRARGAGQGAVGRRRRR